jgi:hypothetical protein
MERYFEEPREARADAAKGGIILNEKDLVVPFRLV